MCVMVKELEKHTHWVNNTFILALCWALALVVGEVFIFIHRSFTLVFFGMSLDQSSDALSRWHLLTNTNENKGLVN